MAYTVSQGNITNTTTHELTYNQTTQVTTIPTIDTTTEYYNVTDMGMNSTLLSDDQGLNKMPSLGILIGVPVAIAFLLILLIIYLCRCRRKLKRQRSGIERSGKTRKMKRWTAQRWTNLLHRLTHTSSSPPPPNNSIVISGDRPSTTWSISHLIQQNYDDMNGAQMNTAGQQYPEDDDSTHSYEVPVKTTVNVASTTNTANTAASFQHNNNTSVNHHVEDRQHRREQSGGAERGVVLRHRTPVPSTSYLPMNQTVQHTGYQNCSNKQVPGYQVDLPEEPTYTNSETQLAINENQYVYSDQEQEGWYHNDLATHNSELYQNPQEAAYANMEIIRQPDNEPQYENPAHLRAAMGS